MVWGMMTVLPFLEFDIRKRLGRRVLSAATADLSRL